MFHIYCDSSSLPDIALIECLLRADDKAQGETDSGGKTEREWKESERFTLRFRNKLLEMIIVVIPSSFLYSLCAAIHFFHLMYFIVLARSLCAAWHLLRCGESNLSWTSID